MGERRVFVERVGAVAVVLASGAQRSFRPLPRQRTWAPTPNTTSPRCRPVTSETRNPVCTVSNNRAWSRRPSQVPWSGAAERASTSGRALSAYIRPRSRIASTTRPVPIAISRMSEATRTKRYPGGGTPICTASEGGRS